MMFLMSEDNISHIAFQHLEAALTLKVLQNKVGQSSRCPQNTHPKILIPTKKSHDQQKIQCPNKSPPWLTKISMSKQNFSMTNKKIFHDQQEISMSKQNFSMPNKTIFFFFFHTHTHKNFHTHRIGLTHSNKIFALIKNEFVQSSSHIKFSRLPYPQNSNQNSFINTTSYKHCQISWVINIVQISPCQIIWQFKKCPKAKITT